MADFAPEDTRTCRKCARVQPLDHFRSIKGGKLVQTCQDCRQNQRAANARSRAPAATLSAALTAPRRAELTEYFRRGVNPDLSPTSAAATREEIAIKRRHRVKRRDGAEPSQTPTFEEIRDRIVQEALRQDLSARQEVESTILDLEQITVAATVHAVNIPVQPQVVLGTPVEDAGAGRRRSREPEAADARRKFSGVHYLVIDEKSMLPPVSATALYTPRSGLSGPGPSRPDDRRGANAYEAFNQSVFLRTIQRQQGEDQAPFRTALEELRKSNCSAQSWELLTTRCAINLTPEEIATFDSVLRVYPTRTEVDEYNYDHMLRLKSPILSVAATHDQGPEQLHENTR